MSYESELWRLIDSIKSQTRLQPLNLGGVTTSGGGGGGPPGGFYGYLPQTRVAGDLSELEVPTLPLSGVTLLDNLNKIRYRISVLESGGGVSTFTALTDTPSSYTGNAGNAVIVNETEDGLVFGVAPGGTWSGIDFLQPNANREYYNTQTVIVQGSLGIGPDTYSTPGIVELTGYYPWILISGEYTVQDEIWAYDFRGLNVSVDDGTWMLTVQATFASLDDTPNSYAGQAGKYPRVKLDETGLEFVTLSGEGGSTSFLGLTDTPDSYTGSDTKFVVVSGTGLNFSTYSPSDFALDSVVDSHLANTSNPHSVTKAQVGLGNVTDDAQLKRSAGDITSFATKTTALTNSDFFLIEEGTAGFVKKNITPMLISDYVESNFYMLHKFVSGLSGEFINQFEQAYDLENSDRLLIEDSSNEYNKRYITWQDILSDLDTSYLTRGGTDFSTFTKDEIFTLDDRFIYETGTNKRHTTWSGILNNITSSYVPATEKTAPVLEDYLILNDGTNKKVQLDNLELLRYDIPFPDGTDIDNFIDNTSTYPADWTEVDSAGGNTTNTVYSYWRITDTATNTTSKYRKQLSLNIESTAADAWNSITFGPILFRDGGYTADLTYSFGIFRNNTGTIDENTYVKIYLKWISSSSKWQVWAEEKDGSTTHTGTARDLSFPLVQPLYFRVMVRNNTAKTARGYLGTNWVGDSHTLLLGQNPTSAPTWGQAWIQYECTRGAGVDAYMLFGGYRYSNDT